MTCYRINHEQIRGCGNQLAKQIICIGAHRVEKYQYRMIRYIKDSGKVCPYITIKYINYEGSYMANSLCYISKQKASTKASKEKKLKKQGEKRKEKVICKDRDDVEIKNKSP